MGIPGVALSLGDYLKPYHFEPLAHFAATHLEAFLSLANSDHFVNINAPNSPMKEPKVLVTHPCRRLYNDRMLSFEAPRGDTFWFLDGTPIDSVDEIGSDWDVVNSGHISLTPIHLHPVKNQIEHSYKKAFESFTTG